MTTALAPLLAAVAHLWAHAPGAQTLAERFPPPAGAARVGVAPDSFGAFLRTLPLLPAGTKVHLYDGRLKPRQDAHVAVVDLDVPPRDLQQCADAVMRLWAEYRYSQAHEVMFHPDPAAPAQALVYRGPFGAEPTARKAFAHWLIRLFASAGSASLQAELQPVAGAIQPGDVLVQGGYPGHAVLVLDVAADATGHRWLLLGQSYMPAQQFHVLVDPASGSPWFDGAALGTPKGLETPEWRPFHARDLRRF